jgi:hypothetical protein
LVTKPGTSASQLDRSDPQYRTCWRKAPRGRTCLPERGLFRALQQLDLRLARALATTDAGNSPVPDDLQGLCLAEEDVARSLARSPGEPRWAYDEHAFDGSELAWLRETLAAGEFGVPVDAFDAELVLIALAFAPQHRRRPPRARAPSASHRTHCLPRRLSLPPSPGLRVAG